MAVTTREIPVAFEGEGSGICAMTWGQQAIWDTIRRTGRTLNIGGVMAMPEGTPVEEITRVLASRWVGTSCCAPGSGSTTSTTAGCHASKSSNPAGQCWWSWM